MTLPQLVNTGDERCCACGAPAVGPSVHGHPLCATHHGLIDYQRELEASRVRREAKQAATLAQCRRRASEEERVAGDRKRAAHGAKAAARARIAVRRNNRSGSESPRAEYDRAYYVAHRAEKVAAAKTFPRCGHPRKDNTYTDPKTSVESCRMCRRRRSAGRRFDT